MRPPPSAASPATAPGPDAATSETAPVPSRPAWVEIDLDALGRNLRLLRARVGEAGILAVVKADAYGHGAVAIAGALEREGADWLGVALVEEGAKLRRAGVSLPILVLGAIPSGEMDDVRQHRLTPAVSSLDQLRMWARAAGERADPEPQSLHLKVDTGMHRLGLSPPEWAEAAALLAATPGLRLDGLLSHLADAEDLESGHVEGQEECFVQAMRLFGAGEPAGRPAGRARELRPGARAEPWLHLANSAAALHRPATRYSLVRAGLALYGIDPTGVETELDGVMSVKARLVQVREIAAGERVGYGGSWTAPRASRIGVVPLGYADGYPWRLGNRARASVDGTFVPVIGAVSMDMITLDLTEVPAARAAVGSVVTLMAGRGALGPTAVELAALVGTLPYEILCHFGLRLPKRYLDVR